MLLGGGAAFDDFKFETEAEREGNTDLEDLTLRTTTKDEPAADTGEVSENVEMVNVSPMTLFTDNPFEKMMIQKPDYGKGEKSPLFFARCSGLPLQEILVWGTVSKLETKRHT